MNVSYYLANPTGNITILVETPVPVAFQPFFAQQLMKAEPSAEQVGFISHTDGGSKICLRMAGGEFCGNATMSTAALYCEKYGIAETEVRVIASGAEDAVPVRILQLAKGKYIGKIQMPRPVNAGVIELYSDGKLYHLPLFRLEGISHLIIREPMERSAAEAAVRSWCTMLNTEALGLMFLNTESGTMTPLVYVPAADTLYWESSCASGTAAAGACIAAEKGVPVSLELLQPGGTLCVDAEPFGDVFLQGTVSFERHGSVFCEESGDNNNL